MTDSPEHFKNQTAIDHVITTQARGMIMKSEQHGTEMPGSIFAGTDAARETAILFLLFSVLSVKLELSPQGFIVFLILIAFGWLIWKAGRSAWLGWSQLERLHRTLAEERWEIEHNRPQEREELKALYSAKGFDGKLLEDVLDVLMADGDRLLKVMVEEEMGLSLEVYEHPLRQAVGAGCGVLAAALICLSFYSIGSTGGLYAAGILILGLSGYLSARFQGNHRISAIVWNIAIGFLAIGSTKFLIDYIALKGWLA